MPTTWTCADGRRIRIWDMTDRHIQAALRYATGEMAWALSHELESRRHAATRARVSPWTR